MRVRKEVIREGSYAYTDKNGKVQFLTATPELIKYWHDSGNQMRAFGLPIPVPLEHDETAHPMTPAERLLNNAGHVHNYEVGKVANDDGKQVSALFSNTDILDPRAQEKIKNGTINWTSPWFTSFTDGEGRPWKSVIGHLALTSRPVLHKQTPFEASFSLTPQKRKPEELPEGFCLSRAGLLCEKEGKYLPVYPVAFSLWTGAKFAFPEKEEKDAKKAPKKEGGAEETEGEEEGGEGGGEDGGGKKPFGKEGEEGEQKPKFDPMTGEPVKTPLVDMDGDIDVWCVLGYLAEVATGIDLGEEEITAENGPEILMRILKDAIKKKLGDGEVDPLATTGPPPVDKAAGSTNPIIQESQPMYMSLEQANAISDPTMKSIALSLVQAQEENKANKKLAETLRQKNFNDAAQKRAKRLANVKRTLPATACAELDALAAGAQFSLLDDGNVLDPLNVTLSILEQQAKNLPALLTMPELEFSVERQPEETNGAMPKEVYDAARKAVLGSLNLAN